ncbi:hypothetical protein BDZ89DRAFT_1132517 [Hymenopellis radicata]|nr:hypothetical protein BDZ89DRAFT_1132517 [Hymenopellis radicata]
MTLVVYMCVTRKLQGDRSVDAIFEAEDSVISDAIAKVGFWRWKTVYIKQAAQKLRDEFNWDVPKTADELCSLPGVGPKMVFPALQIAWNFQPGRWMTGSSALAGRSIGDAALSGSQVARFAATTSAFAPSHHPYLLDPHSSISYCGCVAPNEEEIPESMLKSHPRSRHRSKIPSSTTVTPDYQPPLFPPFSPLRPTMHSLAYLVRQFTVAASRMPPEVVAPRMPPLSPTTDCHPYNPDRRRDTALETPLPRIKT